jgi:hypothetical protein
VALIGLHADPSRPPADVERALQVCIEVLTRLQRAAGASGYQVDRLLEYAEIDHD